MLYNAHQARKGRMTRGVVVSRSRGYMDVIAMAGDGLRQRGRATRHRADGPKKQLAVLWRMADEPILCFDGDKAGRRAAFPRARVALARRRWASLCAWRCCGGKDPDDLAREGGAARWSGCSKRAALIDVLWAR